MSIIKCECVRCDVPQVGMHICASLQDDSELFTEKLGLKPRRSTTAFN
ncbi:hypothetical protein [Nostoc sp.]